MLLGKWLVIERVVTLKLCCAGSKTVVAVAKAKPRPKTIWTTIAKFSGVNETTVRATFWSAVIFIVLLALVLTLTQAPADNTYNF